MGRRRPPGLLRIWSIKPKFAVGGARSCAELIIVDQLFRGSWGAVWVSAFGPGELRSAWFPAPGFRTLADAGAPAWAVEIFERLRAANGGRLHGFFDVSAWREPNQVRFAEAKVGPDRIRDTQRHFLATALRFHQAVGTAKQLSYAEPLLGGPTHVKVCGSTQPRCAISVLSRPSAACRT